MRLNRLEAYPRGVTSVQQNDPDELLEVFDAAGRPTGRAKSRAAIHLDGDWHRAFHCWIVRHAGQQVVLQRRALVKDTFAGCWDAAAAGHWRFGETAAEAAREIGEELGIDVAFSRLVYRGRERSARRMPNGLIDRELHEVYVLADDRHLSLYRPDPGEVIGLAAFEVSDLLGLIAGRESMVPAQEALAITAAGAFEDAHVSVERQDLVPYSAARLRRMLGSRTGH
jgi:isopentenyldiphosphate isomerase